MLAMVLMLVGLGVWFIISAVANWDWFYGILEFGLVEAMFGEGVGRVTCFVYGVALIFGGVWAWFTWI
jgi:hypothetical protein